jgi:hypothetical protein
MSGLGQRVYERAAKIASFELSQKSQRSAANAAKDSATAGSDAVSHGAGSDDAGSDDATSDDASSDVAPAVDADTGAPSHPSPPAPAATAAVNEA